MACCFPQVLVTVPLAILQRGAIQFNPPLSEKKMKAIGSLGAGIIEKVTYITLASEPRAGCQFHLDNNLLYN